MSPEVSGEIPFPRQVMDSLCSGVDDHILERKQGFGLLFVPKDKEWTQKAPPYVFSWEDLKGKSLPMLQRFKDDDGLEPCVGEPARWVIATFLIDLCVVKLKGE